MPVEQVSNTLKFPAEILTIEILSVEILVPADTVSTG